MSTTITDKNVKSMVSAYMLPRIQDLKSSIQQRVNTLLSVTIKLIGDVAGMVSITGDKDINTINTTIATDNHIHPASSIAGSVKATANSLVKRDDDGAIHTSNSAIGETGLKLANGIDISTLFRNVEQAKFTATTEEISSGKYLRTAKLIMDGNQNITLKVYKDSVYTLEPPTNTDTTEEDITSDGCS